MLSEASTISGGATFGMMWTATSENGPAPASRAAST